MNLTNSNYDATKFHIFQVSDKYSKNIQAEYKNKEKVTTIFLFQCGIIPEFLHEFHPYSPLSLKFCVTSLPIRCSFETYCQDLMTYKSIITAYNL